MQQNREEKALKIISYIILSVIGIVILISTISFTVGKSMKYNQVIQEYESALKSQYNFKNIEILQFLKTDDIIEYKKYLNQVIEGDEIGKFTQITVLDTITKNDDMGTYEWFIILNDKAETIYKNTFAPNTSTSSDAVGSFSMSRFELDDKATETAELNVKKQAISGDTSEYISGSVDDIAGLSPTIKNVGALNKYIDDSAGVNLANKLRIFLVESGNNRRVFTVGQSIKNDDKEVSFVLTPEISLDNNNTIRVVYDKAQNIYAFEYVD